MMETLAALMNAMAIPEAALMISLLLTPIASGILVTILRRKRSIELVTVFAASLVLVQSAALIIDIINEKSVSAFDGNLYADAFSGIILLPIAGVGFVSAIYSVSYMGRQYQDGIVDDKNIVRYYQGFNAFLFTMLLVPLANNIGVMWVAIEATTLASVLLIMLYVKENAIV